MLAAAQMRFRLSSIFGFGFALLGALGVGCSFVLDFPEKVEQGPGGSSQGGAGGGGGSSTASTGSAGGCVDPGSIPMIDRVVYEPESDDPMYGTYVGGLLRKNGELYIHGNFAGNLADYEAQFPPNVDLINYMARLDDGDVDVEILGSVSTCPAPCGSLGLFGITLVDDTPVGAGFSNSEACGSEAIELLFNPPGMGPGCGNGTTLQPDPDEPPSLVPFVTGFTLATPVRGVAQLSDGLVLDLHGEETALYGFGLNHGSFWNQSFSTETDYAYNLVRFDPATLTPTDIVFIPGFPMADSFISQSGVSVPGGLTLDDQGDVWATGALCDPVDGFECQASSAFFLARWQIGSDPLLQIPRLQENAASFGSTIAYASGGLIVGGGYTTPLQDTALRTPTSVDPFVLSYTTDSPPQLRWSWPTADSTFEGPVYEAVLDVSVVESPGCPGEGAVYVAGCAVGGPVTIAVPCMKAYGEVDRRGFVAKLDLATGDEIWVLPLAPNAPSSSLFMPTAISADPTGLYVAFNLLGTAEVPGLGTLTGGSLTVESKVLRFSP